MQVTWMIIDTIFSLRRIKRLSRTITILQRLPSKDTMRANYQACIWRRSLQCSPSILDPVGFRRKMGSSAEDESSLPIEWMDGKPAPEAVLERLACRCPRSFRLSDCVCMANVLACTQNLCWLQDPNRTGECGSRCWWTKRRGGWRRLLRSPLI